VFAYMCVCWCVVLGGGGVVCVGVCVWVIYVCGSGMCIGTMVCVCGVVCVVWCV